MRILKFYSPTCGPCKVITERLKEAKLDYEDYDVTNESNQFLIDKYEIKSVPTLVLLKGNIVKKKTGIFSSEELRKWADS